MSRSRQRRRRRRMKPGNVIAAGACGKYPDFLLGYAVRRFRRWGLRMVVDDQGCEWPEERQGVTVFAPGTFRISTANCWLGYPCVVPVAPEALHGL